MTNGTESRTRKALDKIAKWLMPGNQAEGINFQITRLTDPLTSGSLIGGGDCSLLKQSTLESQKAIAYLWDGSSAPSESASITVFFDLKKNLTTLRWPVSSDEIQISTFALVLDTSTTDNTFFFHGANASDGVSYAVTFALL
jgi:hypothetical protein